MQRIALVVESVRLASGFGPGGSPLANHCPIVTHGAPCMTSRRSALAGSRGAKIRVSPQPIDRESASQRPSGSGSSGSRAPACCRLIRRERRKSPNCRWRMRHLPSFITVPPRRVVQYTFDASTAIFKAKFCHDANCVTVPPAMDTFMIEPSLRSLKDVPRFTQ